MDFNTLIAVVIAVISPPLAYYFGVRARQNEARFTFKQDRYQNMLALIADAYVEDSASTKNKSLFCKEFYRSWIYSSSEVVDGINDLRKLFEGMKLEIDPSAFNSVIEKMVRAMRRDLGLRANLTADSLYYSTFAVSRSEDK